MKRNKSITLILIGIGILILAVGNLFFDIPGAIANLQVEHKLMSSQPVTAASVQSNPQDGVNVVSKNVKASQVTDLPQRSRAESSSAAPLPAKVIKGFVPDRIIIPVIGLDAPVVQTDQSSVELQNQWFDQWSVPNEYAAGWPINTAPLGMSGNTVLAGHHNEYGEVFKHLIDLQLGDLIYVYSGDVSFIFKITNKLLLPEKNAPIEVRKANAAWIAPTVDERLTLVTCWPQNNNTHRVIIVAEPVNASQAASRIPNLGYNSTP